MYYTKNPAPGKCAGTYKSGGIFQTKRKLKPPVERVVRLSKKSKIVAVGGHAPTTATPPGKFYGKLCARNEVTSAR
ncbi:hypothetical protein, partial [uncultured Subdoligranulum sp.]|uniref:hypothetical protein n=1 Tax=uncultured Subdoligranulum sp. TaxID=512298 RepID=UPI0025F84B8E